MPRKTGELRDPYKKVVFHQRPGRVVTRPCGWKPIGSKPFRVKRRERGD